MKALKTAVVFAIALAMLIVGAIPAFAQTGVGMTTTYYNMSVNHVRIDALPGATAQFTTTNPNFKRISNWEAVDQTVPFVIAYNGTVNWGTKNRTEKQDAVTGETVVPGLFTLRYPNAATTYDGLKKDVVITISDVRLYNGVKPSGVTTAYFPILNLYYDGTTALTCGHGRTNTTAASTFGTSQASRYKVDTAIVEPGTNTPINSNYSNVMIKFVDFDVPDKLTKNYSYSGRFAEGVGLISGFRSPYLLYPNTKLVSQTVDSVQKIRGSSTDEATDQSGVVLTAAPQGFSYYWYGAVAKGKAGASGATKMATGIGTTPVVNVVSSSGPGGSIDKEGTNYFGINMPQVYTYTPEPGWVVKSVVAGGVPQAVNDSNLHGGSYTFPKLTTNNSLRVEFEPPQVNVTKTADKQYYQKGDVVTYTIKLNNKTGIMSVDFAKEQLQSLVRESEPFLEQTDVWTPESLSALSDEINAAKALINNSGATIPQLQEEMERLSAKVANLAEREKTPAELLQAKIEEARELLDSGAEYTAETRQALEDAIAAGEALTNPDADAAFNAIAAISDAMDNLRIEGREDIRDLLAEMATKMEEAEPYLENEEDYTDSSIEALRAAYDQADSLASSADEEIGSVSNEDVKDATSALEEALANMETWDDALAGIKSEAQELLNSQDYTEESIQGLQDALDAVEANPPETAAEKKEAIQSIRDAINALAPRRSSGNSAGTHSSFFASIPKTFGGLLKGPTRAPSYNYPGTYDTNVVLTEELPDYLQMIGYKVSGGSVEAYENKLTFSVPVLGDESYTMTVKARVIKDVDAPVDVTNEVTATGDISPVDGKATSTITVVKPELQVLKESDKADYHKGDTVHYTINVSNIAEHSWANNVVITDSNLSAGQVLKAGTVTCSDAEAVITEENGTFKATIPELLGTESETIEFDATINNADIVAKELTNTASVVCDQLPDPFTAEAEAQIVYDVDYEWNGAHPNVNVPDGQENIPWGEEYTVDTTYKAGDKVKGNVDGQKGSWVFNGWDQTGTLIIKDDLTIRGSWTFIPEYDITTSADNGTITPTETDIPQGENRVITYAPNIGYQLKTLTVDGESKSTTEYPSSYAFENIRADHRIHAEFELIPGLEVIKDADKEIYNAGDTVTYTITVRQTVSGAEAREVILSDTLPEGVTLNKDSFSDNVEVIEATDNLYRISIPSLTDEVTYTYTAITEKAADHEELINTASAGGSNVPEDAEDDAKVKSLTPKPEIEKIVSNENPIYGEEITYWIRVKEPQEGIELRNAVIRDTLPEGVVYEGGETSYEGDQGEFAISEEGEFEAKIPVLSTEAVCSFKVRVTAIEGKVDNVATLTGDDIKPLTANAVFTVKEPEPVLTKAVSREEASVGDTATYTVTASSEIALVDAVIEDTLPDGIELVDGSVNCSDKDAEISVSGKVIRAKVKSLKEAVTITYEAKITAPGEHTNTVGLTAYNFPKGPVKASAKITGFRPVPQITKEVNKEKVKVGESAAYTINALTEKGTIYNAVITDKIPKGLQIDEDSIKVSGGEASVEGNTLTVRAATLTQTPLVITYKVTAKKKGDHENIAMITADNTDGPLEASASLEVYKPASPKTGDASNWHIFAIFGISVILFAMLIRKRLKE